MVRGTGHVVGRYMCTGGGVTDSLSMVRVLDTWSVHVERGRGGLLTLKVW